MVELVVDCDGEMKSPRPPKSPSKSNPNGSNSHVEYCPSSNGYVASRLSAVPFVVAVDACDCHDSW